MFLKEIRLETWHIIPILTHIRLYHRGVFSIMALYSVQIILCRRVYRVMGSWGHGRFATWVSCSAG